ncbi:flagellar hook assembly protein FlgD [Jeotgalibacillus haloalkalitolerans]|uniref:Basal-body rod modification protein FlgD n=1 Tax=Jeotgalibacillus haloalkalitolerans TaxID=3104292 RepID=A0ABU5KKD8_9BACL|nr:flagellar hook assembly protein FlgD [Jeotgalibacillus sp. HH7-29]MDZ5711724.1 flagellar hook assembly protein FlgD [Jeotgalibacillus sp. HH7-29]
MNPTSINESLYLSSLENKKLEPKDQSMGKDQFLKLLIAQLQNQDPTQPMEDKEFISQMANFSSLEQMTNMANSFEKFATMQEQTALIQYNEFVGKEVKWDKMESVDGEQVAINGKGIVETVKFKGGSVEFTLEDGTSLTPGNISEVNKGELQDSLQQASMIIGKKVSWMKDDKEIESTVVSVSRKDGAIWLHTSDQQRIAADELIKIAQ